MKHTLYDFQARQTLAKGVELLARAVLSTQGPRGRNVVIANSRTRPRITKDGVSVAKEFEATSPELAVGVNMVRDVAVKAAKKAGDGTTTSICLANAIVQHGVELLEQQPDLDVIRLQREIETVSSRVQQLLLEQAEPCTTPEQFYSVAMIASNGDEAMSSIIRDAFADINEDGVVMVSDIDGLEDVYEKRDGMALEAGWLNAGFVTNMERMSAEYKDAKLLVLDGDLEENDQNLLLPLAEIYPALIVVADHFPSGLVERLRHANNRSNANILPIRNPVRGKFRQDFNSDIATYTGASVVLVDELVPENVDFIQQSLGTVDEVHAFQTHTVINVPTQSEERQKDLEATVAGLKQELSHETNEKLRNRLSKRISNLTGGVAMIQVGGETDLEVSERRDRYDDAICSVRAAREMGLVKGGGNALVGVTKAVFTMEDISIETRKLMCQVLTAPFRQILDNCGVAPVTGGMADPRIGFSVLDGEFIDLFEAGIVDPVKVTITALEASTSIASLILTTECLIYEENEHRDKMMNFARNDI